MLSTEKRVRDSISEMAQFVLPNDTNVLGNLLGGTLMHWIDLVGAMAANRHSRTPIVTASMEGLDFLVPIRLGQLVILKGKLHHAGNSSMEVGVEVLCEDTLNGKQTHASSAILTYVAVNMDGRPVPVPKLICETDEEKTCYREAVLRKAQRESRHRQNIGEEHHS